jgi:glycogen synthase kinase 3 beta
MDCEFYTSSIDIWAAGCVLAEVLMAGVPLFAGSSAVGQLHEIVKVIGPPTEADLATFLHSSRIQMAPDASTSLERVLPRHTPPDLMDLMKRIFVYQPGKRPSAQSCMNHCCFDELFQRKLQMPDGRPFPVLERSGPA